jgi:DNA sulfur modification protein DndC
MTGANFQAIRDQLTQLYLADPRPWLVGFSGGKDSTLLASLIFETILVVPRERRTKEVHVVCTDTRVEIPAVVEMIEITLERMRKLAAEQGLNIEVHLLRPPPEQSFWVNIIGRGYPPMGNYEWRMRNDEFGLS